MLLMIILRLISAQNRSCIAWAFSRIHFPSSRMQFRTSRWYFSAPQLINFPTHLLIPQSPPFINLSLHLPISDCNSDIFQVYCCINSPKTPDLLIMGQGLKRLFMSFTNLFILKNMKNLTGLLAMLVIVTLTLSCEKEKKTATDILDKETISAKWLVDASDEYESFEFNESGSYIVVRNTVLKSTEAREVLFGTYEILNDNKIRLSDFGTVVFEQLSENQVRLTITLEGASGEPTSVEATKQEEMTSTSRTEMLCRTWSMVAINGEEVKGTEYELSVLFSVAGTYFVEYANPDAAGDGGLASWKWYDQEEVLFYYSWENPPVWDETNVVEIITLSSDSLKILETYTEEYSELYELIPIEDVMPDDLKSAGSSKATTLRQGWLKR